MKCSWIGWGLAVLLSQLALAGPSLASPLIVKDRSGVTLKLNAGDLRLQVWSDRIIRVTFAPPGHLPADNSLSVIAKPQDVRWNEVDTADQVTLTTGALRVRADLKSGAVDFQDSNGNSFLSEESEGGRTMTPATIQGQPMWKIKQVFQHPEDEAIFGLGQHQDGWMNLAGRKVHLQQENRLVGIPVLMSSRGY
jgi:alpha-D-xyloside xylohydrolase